MFGAAISALMFAVSVRASVLKDCAVQVILNCLIPSVANVLLYSYKVEVALYVIFLLRESEKWRTALIGDPEADLLLQVLYEFGGIMEIDKLKVKLIDYSMRFDVTNAIIKRLSGSGDIKLYGNKIYTRDEWINERGKK